MICWIQELNWLDCILSATFNNNINSVGNGIFRGQLVQPAETLQSVILASD